MESKTDFIVPGEPNIDKRIESAKAKANRIYCNKSETDNETILALRFILCKNRSALKGIYDHYFDNLTIDELILEIELEKLVRNSDSGEKQMSEIIKDKDNKKELENMFDDWLPKNQTKPAQRSASQPKKQWVDVKNKMSDDDMNKMVDKFMETGEFIKEEDK